MFTHLHVCLTLYVGKDRVSPNSIALADPETLEEKSPEI